MRRAILAAALCAAACAQQPPPVEIQTAVPADQPVAAPPAAAAPVAAPRVPCPNPADIPAVPARVAAQHPTMPRRPDGSVDWQEVSRILGAKIIELFAYVGPADAIMRTCSKGEGGQ